MWDFILLSSVKQILTNRSSAHSSQMHKQLVLYTIYIYTEKLSGSHREAEKILWKAPKLLEHLLPNALVYFLQHWWVLQKIKNKKIQTHTCGCKELFFFRESDLGCCSGFCVYIYILEWALTPHPGRTCFCLWQKLLSPYKCTSSAEGSSPQAMFAPSNRKESQQNTETYSCLLITYSFNKNNLPITGADACSQKEHYIG